MQGGKKILQGEKKPSMADATQQSGACMNTEAVIFLLVILATKGHAFNVSDQGGKKIHMTPSWMNTHLVFSAIVFLYFNMPP